MPSTISGISLIVSSNTPLLSGDSPISGYSFTPDPPLAWIRAPVNSGQFPGLFYAGGQGGAHILKTLHLPVEQLISSVHVR